MRRNPRNQQRPLSREDLVLVLEDGTKINLLDLLFRELEKEVSPSHKKKVA